jgi:cyanophycinase
MSKTEKLILFGGGKLPQLGLETFFEWTSSSPRDSDELLVVTWASEEAPITADVLQRRFRSYAPGKISISLDPPTTDRERGRFLEMLARAGGVFFSGGDQNRCALAFDHSEIGTALQSAYRLGIPFAGTSAGTAMMSELMITGDGDPGSMKEGAVPVRSGLGVLEGTVVDQHFLRRQRQNRLFSVVLRHPDYLGIGVDEDTGLAIIGGRFGTVVGPEKVMLVSARERSSLAVDLFEPGESVDLSQYAPKRVAATKVS